MAINKVNANGRTLIDLTADTVTPETLMEGMTAHNSKGELIVGIVPNPSPVRVSKTGERIYIDDVSENLHCLNVNLTSNTITNFENVKLKVTGKNLVDGNAFTLHGGSDIRFFEENPITLLKNVTYTFSTSTQMAGMYIVSSTDSSVLKTKYNSNKITYTPSDNYSCYLEIYDSNKDFKTFDVKPQLEIGTVVTEFEPYKEHVYFANADGSVDGVKSISPVMHISTDAAGVVITATYIADTKKYIDNKVLEVQKGVLANV